MSIPQLQFYFRVRRNPHSNTALVACGDNGVGLCCDTVVTPMILDVSVSPSGWAVDVPFTMEICAKDARNGCTKITPESFSE